MKRFATIVLRLALALWLVLAGAAPASSADKPFEPVSGQAGKDVVWVPTPPLLVEKMLDLAKVTPRDFVMDLGSGDGRNIIAAAKRGARALGVEYNPDMVEVSKRIAEKEGVAGKALFVQGDMYEADISQASVLALFLLPENLDRLVPKFLDLKPGSRIVLNTFGIRGWDPDQVARAEDPCGAWCDALLYIVPAKVAGRWRLNDGEIAFEQTYQLLSGSYVSAGASTPIANAWLNGERIGFTLDGVEYSGVVNGDTIQGSVGGTASWQATRIEKAQ
ncbi:MAG: methyltransferase domain-containing protein [Burkholderiales bacterium]|nr:methyltransferase domain-containing protein [Burkholderiales bacterium]